jgi:hypothetical protein
MNNYNLFNPNRALICANTFAGDGEGYSVVFVLYTSPFGNVTEKYNVSFGLNLIVCVIPLPSSLINDDFTGLFDPPSEFSPLLSFIA